MQEEGLIAKIVEFIRGGMEMPETRPYPVCDAHVHLLPERLTGAILNWFEELGWTMPYRLSVEDLIQHLQSTGVKAAFALGYVHKAGMAAGINLWLKELHEHYPWLHPFAAVHQDDDIEPLLKQALDEWDFPGVKVHTFVQKVAANDPRLWPVYRMVAERSKGIILHLSAMPVASPYIGVASLRDVLREFPNLKVMIAHMGLPNDYDLALELATEYPNVYLDTAYILGNPRFPLEERWLTAFSTYPDKFVFGSDFPIMDYPPEDGMTVIETSRLSGRVRDRLLWKNAESFLGRSLR